MTTKGFLPNPQCERAWAGLQGKMPIKPPYGGRGWCARNLTSWIESRPEVKRGSERVYFSANGSGLDYQLDEAGLMELTRLVNS